jgi:hypothetical protein
VTSSALLDTVVGDALDTAVRVVAWAADPCGPPPVGSLRHARRLAAAPALPRDTVEVPLARLVRRTAARLGTGNPPLGDPAPAGPGALLLAAAIGGRTRPDLARKLAYLLPVPRLTAATGHGWCDAVARHAVVGPYLDSAVAAVHPPPGTRAATSGDGPAGVSPSRPDPAGAGEDDDHAPGTEETLVDALLRVSPLGAVLHHPAPGQADQAVDVALALLARPRGSSVLAGGLAAPRTGDTGRATPAEMAVARWRARLLGRLARTRPEVVVDILVTARACHGPEWDLHLAGAAHALDRPGPADAAAVAAMQFWAPLTSAPVARLLRTRSLITGHEPALTLVHRYGLVPAEAP